MCNSNFMNRQMKKIVKVFAFVLFSFCIGMNLQAMECEDTQNAKQCNRNALEEVICAILAINPLSFHEFWEFFCRCRSENQKKRMVKKIIKIIKNNFSQEEINGKFPSLENISIQKLLKSLFQTKYFVGYNKDNPFSSLLQNETNYFKNQIKKWENLTIYNIPILDILKVFTKNPSPNTSSNDVNNIKVIFSKKILPDLMKYIFENLKICFDYRYPKIRKELEKLMREEGLLQIYEHKLVKEKNNSLLSSLQTFLHTFVISMVLKIDKYFPDIPDIEEMVDNVLKCLQQKNGIEQQTKIKIKIVDFNNAIDKIIENSSSLFNKTLFKKIKNNPTYFFKGTYGQSFYDNKPHSDSHFELKSLLKHSFESYHIQLLLYPLRNEQ